MVIRQQLDKISEKLQKSGSIKVEGHTCDVFFWGEDAHIEEDNGIFDIHMGVSLNCSFDPYEKVPEKSLLDELKDFIEDRLIEYAPEFRYDEISVDIVEIREEGILSSPGSPAQSKKQAPEALRYLPEVETVTI